MAITLGRPIKNAAVLHAKRYIQNHTNNNGFITIERLCKINNRAARETALNELGYLPKYSGVHRLTGYYKP